MTTTNSEEDSVNLWFLDTGCSNHMIGYKEWFVNIDDKMKNKIKFADNTYELVEWRRAMQEEKQSLHDDQSTLT